MKAKKRISLKDVILDSENARHGEKETQEEIYDWMSSGPIASKVLKLASDIAEKGISPLDNLGVIPSRNGAPAPWTVIEGNRRIAALKFLNNPKLCRDLKARKQYQQLKQSAKTPISKSIEFAVFDSFEDASYWIQIRHGGENAGAGTINWGTKEFDSFAARLGKKTTIRPAIALLDYALRKGLINLDQYREIPVTTLYRLLSTPAFRKKIGCHISKGELYRVSDQAYFDRAVESLLKILASGKITVTDLKTLDQRKDFAERLKKEGDWNEYEEQSPLNINTGSTEPPQESQTTSNGESIPNKSEDQSRKPRGASKPSWDRTTLFTRNKDGLSIPEEHSKARNIVAELRRLKTGGSNGTPIAVAMLLRALIEISTNKYREEFKLKPEQDFHRQVAQAADHMLSSGFIKNEQYTAIVRMSRETEGMLHVKTLQKYVHSEAFHPSSDVLNTLWDQISCYVSACWVKN